MSLYTVNKQVTLIQGDDPTSALAAWMGGNQMPTVAAGEIVNVSDPPSQIAGYTQVTTVNGTVGWVPTNALSSGVVGSTLVNVGIGVAAIAAIWYFFIRK